MKLDCRMWLELKGKIGFLTLSFYHHPKQINTQRSTVGSIGLWPTKFNFPSPHFYTLPSLSPRPEGEAAYLTRNIGKRFRGTRVACAAFGSFTQNLSASRLCPFSLLGKLLGQVGPSQVLQPHFIANEYFHFRLLCLSSK